jgi:hypothetical protein
VKGTRDERSMEGGKRRRRNEEKEKDVRKPQTPLLQYLFELLGTALLH